MAPSFYCELLATYHFLSRQTILITGDVDPAFISALRALDLEPFHSSAGFEARLFRCSQSPKILILYHLTQDMQNGVGVFFQTTAKHLRLGFRTYFARMLLSHFTASALGD